MDENETYQATTITIRSARDQYRHVEWEIKAEARDAAQALAQAMAGAKELMKLK